MKITSLLAPSVMLSVILTAAQVKAQESDYLLDFSEKATFNACIQTSLQYDHDSYDVWTYNNYSGFPYMYNYNITEPFYDDYLITAGLQLQSGHLYRLETAPAAYNSGKMGKLEIYIGTDDNYVGYTLLKSLTDLPYSNKTSVQLRTIDFTVPEDGTYHIAFRGIGNALYLYDTTLSDLGVSSVPSSVTGLTLLPAVDGSQNVTLSFTMPMTTKSGSPLDGNLSYRIYRQDGTDPVKGGRGIPGENISWTDADAPLGNVTYSVAVIQGVNESDRVSASTFVGAETPLPVTALNVSKTDGGYTLSWAAPGTGIHGAVLDPSMMTYRVERYVDEILDNTVNNISNTTYTDNYSTDGMHSVMYKVYAVLGENVSEATASNTLTVGSSDLPFADSFAGATFGNNWTAEIINGTINWEAVASATTQQPTPTPQDGDGGMAKYASWSAQRGHSARLYTIPLSKSSSTNPMIEFYVCRSSTNNSDKVIIEVSCDGGQWTALPESEVIIGKGTANTWEKHSFSLSEAIAGAAESYRVAITSVSDYGHNTYVDNVRIFNISEYDLATAISVPQALISGNDLQATITVTNNGTHDVAAGDYTLELLSDYPGTIPEIETVDIPALDRREINVTLPVNAPLVKDMSAYSFQAKVNYADDLVLSNNLSNPTTTAVSFSSHPGVTEVNSEDLADGSVRLSWDGVGDGHLPVNFAESFESFDDGAEGPFNGFTVLDIDGKAGSNYYNTSGSALHVINKGTVPTKVDGTKLLGCTTKANVQQDDWLISPELNAADGGSMTLSFGIAAKKFSSSYDYKYEILYATGDYDPANPSEAFTHNVVSVTSSNYRDVFRSDEAMWQQTIEGIPAEAKYVAIHLISKISYDAAVWIDNVRISENIPYYLTGYNVYDTDGQKCNESLLAPQETSFVVTPLTRSQRQCYVVAVYNDGEATPSPEVSVSTGIAAVSSATAAISTAHHSILVSNSTFGVIVYDAAGRNVATAPAAERISISVVPGLYIVKTGQMVKKVIVK